MCWPGSPLEDRDPVAIEPEAPDDEQPQALARPGQRVDARRWWPHEAHDVEDEKADDERAERVAPNRVHGLGVRRVQPRPGTEEQSSRASVAACEYQRPRPTTGPAHGTSGMSGR